jgi:hypothetical protein
MEEYAFITNKHIVHHTFALMKHINTHLSKLYLVDPMLKMFSFNVKNLLLGGQTCFFPLGMNFLNKMYCTLPFHELQSIDFIL